ncbi:MAG TPA: hypothetical protein VJT31_19765 [Rugosimonospora sp.]|nr:hypothetical protein [Rugosimonospora sp.]
MPSHLHEGYIELFRGQPELTAEVLGPLGVEIPAFDRARVSASELTDIAPTEYRADAVVALEKRGSPAMAIVIEIQLRADKRKRLVWPAYATTLRARLACPVVLMAVCPDQKVADWCGQTITIGPPASVLTPVALGPKQIPVVTDVDAARRKPELAVLSVLAHGAEPDPAPLFEAMLAALDEIDHDHATLYTDLVLTELPAAARRNLEEFMTATGHRYQSEFARRYYDQGEAAGEARGRVDGELMALFRVLETRGIEVSEQIRDRIVGCTDLKQLETWIGRAVTADKIEDLGDGLTES